MLSCNWSACSRRRFVRFLPLMKRRRFGRRVTRVVMRLAGVFEASFRQIFGGFLNTEGFCRVFILGLGGFLSYSHIKTKNFFRRASGFSLFAFSGEFSSASFFFFFYSPFQFASLFRSIWSCYVCRLSLFLWESLDSPRTA